MSLFTILPITVPDATLPQIPLSDVEFFGEGEQNSYGHWILNSGPAAFTDIVNGRVLTPNGIAPAYYSNYINISSDSNDYAIKSDLYEPASTGGYTLCGVIRQKSAGLTAITWGTLGTGVDNKGGSTYWAGGNANKWLHTYRGAASSIDSELSQPTDEWYFVAVSVSYINLTSWQAAMVLGGVGQSSVGPGTGTYTPNPDQPISIGNIEYSANSSSYDFAEFILFDSALSINEMQAIYLRSKARMASRGITIL